MSKYISHQFELDITKKNKGMFYDQIGRILVYYGDPKWHRFQDSQVVVALDKVGITNGWDFMASFTETDYLVRMFNDEKLDDIQVCNRMFTLLNVGLPEMDNPFATPEMQEHISELPSRHTSMSVGDIIVINRHKKTKAYLCMNMGWKDVSEQVKLI